ncbi:hypothetical protein UYO_1437 [Lachnospiraceae bacterium JC7]|nr:hypothetical protein UYO_1437 [Lachnospiraceae bacterium JC7]
MKNLRTSAFYAGLAAFTIITSAVLTGCGSTSIPAVSIQAQTEATLQEDTSDSTVSDGTISVSATGQVYVVPDMAEISFGITTENSDVKKAQEINSKDTQKVIDKLKELGIDEKSIKTSGYDVYPQYDYDTYGEERIVGYNVNTMLTVKDLKTEESGNVISQCVDAGINTMSGISFSCSNYDEAYNEALAKAVKKAEEKAQALADASGKTLGEVIYIEEGYQDCSLQYTNMYMNDLESSVAKADATILPGESDIQASVTIAYSVR